MVSVSFHLVNAFITSFPNSGNPAAVVLLPLGSPPSDDQFHKVATRIQSPHDDFRPASGRRGTRLLFCPMVQSYRRTAAMRACHGRALESVVKTTGRTPSPDAMIRHRLELPASRPLRRERTRRYRVSRTVEIQENERYIIVEMDQTSDIGALEIDCKQLSPLAKKDVLLTQVAQPPHQRRALIPYYLSHPPATARLKASHTVDLTFKVHQRSPEGGEMIVTWLKNQGRVRVMGDAVVLKSGEIEI
ncbi:hypothetical protein P7C73_g697, partial [Tremellales sp. Uapishka_1]